jgi:hypothetical protein
MYNRSKSRRLLEARGPRAKPPTAKLRVVGGAASDEELKPGALGAQRQWVPGLGKTCGRRESFVSAQGPGA